jgi:phage repressor protein C with HTH and peptisase S24 domain
VVTVKVGDKFIYSNQIAIVKLLMEHKNSLVLFNSLDKKHPREKLFASDEMMKNKESIVWYHRALVDLLSQCARGKFIHLNFI